MKPPRIRKQVGLHVLFPHRKDGLCACGCGKSLPPNKRRWASQECVDRVLPEYYIWKGNPGYIRARLFDRDSGICAKCGKFDEKWQADHIIAVVNGGGCCGLDGYQTLCISCHKEKTRADVKLARTRNTESQ